MEPSVPRILPLGPDLLQESAELVAYRYREERRHEHLLPERFESAESVIPKLREVLERGPALGAVRDGRLVAFQAGYPAEHRGVPSVWIPDYGHALAEGEPAETCRALYADLSARWVADGCISHMVTLTPRDHPSEEAWFSLGFGLTVVDALRDLQPTGLPGAAVEIRRATTADLAQVQEMERAMWDHLAAPPVFLPVMGEKAPSSRPEWLAEERNALFLASVGGRSVGLVGMEPCDGVVLPRAGEGTVALTLAWTDVDERTKGIGTALLDHALDWARREGYRLCAVDFETANLSGSRFWYDRGFRTVCRSLGRSIDPRLVPGC